MLYCGTETPQLHHTEICPLQGVRLYPAPQLRSMTTQVAIPYFSHMSGAAR